MTICDDTIEKLKNTELGIKLLYIEETQSVITKYFKNDYLHTAIELPIERFMYQDGCVCYLATTDLGPRRFYASLNFPIYQQGYGRWNYVWTNGYVNLHYGETLAEILFTVRVVDDGTVMLDTKLTAKQVADAINELYNLCKITQNRINQIMAEQRKQQIKQEHKKEMSDYLKGCELSNLMESERIL